MTNYEFQVARNRKYADRTEVLVQTPTLLMFEVDGKVTYVHEYDEHGKCIKATWWLSQANH